MSADKVEKIANAVLYEGYILYPYRASAIKNQQRWNFGTLAPGETMQTECLVRGAADSALDVKVRFLQMQAREGEVWNEAIDRTVHSCDLRLRDLAHKHAFAFDHDIDGIVETTAEAIDEGLFRINVRIRNLSPPMEGTREEILLRSVVSTHTILGIRQGEFISLLDPPEAYRREAAKCRNQGTWPVLAGEEGTKDTMLSSPIILYDYPQIAPESPGDLFDGLEIDEILSLRILTLTDAEKQEVREGDERGRELLDRTEALPWEDLMKLHGVMRSIHPGSGA